MAIIVQPTELHQTVRTPETAATPSRRKSRWAYRGLTVLDVFLHVFVASTIVIGIWRASYQLYIAYYDYINPWFATGASVFVQLLLSVLSDPLVKYFKQKNHSKIAFWVVSRVYIYSRFVSGMFMYVCQEWLLELSLSEVHKVVPNEIVLLICIIILCLITKLASIMGPPTCGFEFDPKPEEIFQFDRMFWPENGTGSWLYVLDSFFSVCIIGSLVVIVWRGVWNIMDKCLYPETMDFSAILSLIIGYTIVLTAFALQPVIKKFVNKLSGFKKLLTVDIYLLFSFVGAVNVWRGLWILLDHYFIPEAPVTSYWISHIACFVFLVLVNSSNSILVRGVYIDAEEDGTQCVDFPCYYVRLLVQKRKRRKQRHIEEEDKEMMQIKVGIDEQTNNTNQKILLPNENGGTIFNETEEQEEMLNSTAKIV
ncbi:Protein fuseless [Cinara cedri]|uniref:Protein fuseless n=1 Tax=Cinara cedri TaxID=506608 RepID=A0A5E4MHV4_9HEMI|nr:Protein fuseless [Cinara cedri]